MWQSLLSTKEATVQAHMAGPLCFPELRSPKQSFLLYSWAQGRAGRAQLEDIMAQKPPVKSRVRENRSNNEHPINKSITERGHVTHDPFQFTKDTHSSNLAASEHLHGCTPFFLADPDPN